MIKKAIAASKEEDDGKVLVLVGSSNKQRAIKNPLTFVERRDILYTIFGGDIVVRPLPDYDYQYDVWETNLHNVIFEYANMHLKERHFLPVFVSSDRGDDSEQRDFWKSGGDTLVVDPYICIDGSDISATKVRGILSKTAIGKVYEEEDLQKMMPLESRQFFDEHQDIHSVIVKEQEAIDNYNWIWEFNKTPYPVIFQATDAFVTDSNGDVLLIKRGGDFGNGQIAMAGGYLEHDLTLKENMKKELLEETNLDLSKHRHLISGSWTCDAPLRSARGRMITTAFAIHLVDTTIEDLLKSGEVVAGDDASEVLKVPLFDIKSGHACLYSDHAGIITKLCQLYEI